MAEFAKYYLDFLWKLVQNIWEFILGIISAFVKIFSEDIPSYFFDLSNAVQGFNIFGWIVLILVILINFTLVFFIFYRIYLSIRKYFFVRHTEIEKEELLEELAVMKNQVERLSLEKNKIFELKFNEINNLSTLNNEQEEEKEILVQSRFSKLSLIDAKYKLSPHFINMRESDNLNLSEVIQHFIYFSASQLKLYYSVDTARLFFAGMATSKVIILEGISGTGKTSLPYAISKYFGNNAQIVSVQPSWRDRTELLGYFNEFAKKFNETEFLASLYEATYREDPNFIVLDEMNLARIEYYFAEFLSIMEMPDTSEWKIDIVPSVMENDPKHLSEGKLIVPQNIWFIGTANQDDSTFTITDKVYDRAVGISLNNKAEYFSAPITESVNISYDYLETLFNRALNEHRISENSLANLKKLDVFIQDNFKIAFGNRIMKQIKLFVPTFMASGGTEFDGIDFMFQSKILRKFTSLNLVFLSKEINDLITMIDKLFGKNNFKQSKEYLKFLVKNI
jgi:hypothetical protein